MAAPVERQVLRSYHRHLPRPRILGGAERLQPVDRFEAVTPELPVRADLDRIFAKAGLGPPKVRVESNHITMAQFNLMRGTGLVALAQRGSLKGLKRLGIEVLKVSGLNIKREIAVMRRAGGFASPLSRRLEQLLVLATQARTDAK